MDYFGLPYFVIFGRIFFFRKESTGQQDTKWNYKRKEQSVTDVTEWLLSYF